MPTSEAESLKILNMGLPVERIMAEVEEEMLHMDEEVNGEPAEVEHMDELNEDLEKDLDGIAIEVVEGNKPGSRWLIVDFVHICHEQKVFLKHDVWRCEDFREYK
mgnify:FL=1